MTGTGHSPFIGFSGHNLAVKGQKSPLGDQQIRQAKQRKELDRVLRQD